MSENPFVHWAGLDWGDREHRLAVTTQDEEPMINKRVPHTPEGVAELLETLKDVPHLAGVAIETSRHLVVDLLVDAGFTVYAVNPAMAHAWRRSQSVAAPKSDERDAWSLAIGLRHHHKVLRPFSEEGTVRELRMLCEQEQRLIAQRTSRACELKAVLKYYYPAALEWFDQFVTPSAWDFLLAFPTPHALSKSSKSKLYGFCKTHRIPLMPKTCQRIDNRTRATALAADVPTASVYAIRAQALARQLHGLQTGIDQYRRRIRELFRLQPMAPLFSSLPGAGDKLAPRLLAMFGTCKNRYAGAKNVAELAGVAPVTDQSGNSRHVKFRHSCKKLYRTTMHHFAWTSTRFCPWAYAYYHRCRDRGQSHPLALRNLAAKWLKIIYRMWQDGTPYDDARYIEALKHAESPLALKLNEATTGG